MRRTLAPLVLVYGLGAQAEAPAFWRVYEEVLADLPRLALERGVSEFQRVGRFFPKPAEVRDLALPHASAMRMAATRAKRAADWSEPKPVENRIPAEKCDALLADALKRIAANGEKMMPTRPTRKPPSGRLAEGRTMTPEMMQLLGRQS